jgi:hypothetical protein
MVNGIGPVVAAIAGGRRAKRQRIPETWGPICLAELAAAAATGGCTPQFNGQGNKDRVLEAGDRKGWHQTCACGQRIDSGIHLFSSAE